MSDLPTSPSSTLLVYADDITLLYRAPSIPEAQEGLQSSLDRLHQWTTRWGLTISPQKSRLMCFTRKRVSSLPTVSVDHIPLPYTTSHRVLGLVFDGPILTFRQHVTYLRTSCMKRLDVMKRVSGIRWGADRDTLLFLYKTFIHSKLQYGSAVYGTASRTTLQKLDTVQSSALRIALGAFISSPISSLHAEAGLLPLDSTRQAKCLRTFYRVSTSAPSHPLTEVLRSINRTPPVGSLSSLSSLERASLRFAILGLPSPSLHDTASAVSPIPPMHALPYHISLDLGSPFIKASDPPHLARQLFLHQHHTSYSTHFPIYTDGSHCPDRQLTSAAIYIPDLTICRTWRLSSFHSVLAAELFAILCALRHLTPLSPGRVVIYSDSRSGLHLIGNRSPRTHS